jgi:hypothetical protein
MTKRGIIKLATSFPIFRVSKPGVDVDAAGPEDLLIHEDAVFLQPYYFGFAACPFAGFTGSGVKDQSVTVTVPNIGQVPDIFLWAVEQTNIISYPMLLSEGSGDSQTYYNVTQNYIEARFVAPASVQFRFVKVFDSRYSLKGCYFMLSRSADA